jgi:hypothetical protein
VASSEPIYVRLDQVHGDALLGHDLLCRGGEVDLRLSRGRRCRHKAERDVEPDEACERARVPDDVGPALTAHPVAIITAAGAVRDNKTDHDTFMGVSERRAINSVREAYRGR